MFLGEWVEYWVSVCYILLHFVVLAVFYLKEFRMRSGEVFEYWIIYGEKKHKPCMQWSEERERIEKSESVKEWLWFIAKYCYYIVYEIYFV